MMSEKVRAGAKLALMCLLLLVLVPVFVAVYVAQKHVGHLIVAGAILGAAWILSGAL